MALIDDMIRDSRRYASDAIGDANNALLRLRGRNFGQPPEFPPKFDIPNAPKAINLSPSGLTPPSLPQVDSFNKTFTPGTIENPTPPAEPVNTAAKQAINVPSAPNASIPDAPVEPTLKSIPDPNFGVIPPLPSLPTITPPSVIPPKTLKIPIFVKNAPTTTLNFQGQGLSYYEQPYSGALLVELETFMRNKLAGGTGLKPEVERQIWDRDFSREIAIGEALSRTAIEDVSARGFSSPTGSMIKRIAIASEQVAEKASVASRDIAIKQAELEQANDKEFAQLAIQLEGMQLQHFDKVAERALEVEKSVIELNIQVFNAQVGQFNAELARYRVDSEVFAEEVRAAIADAEVYKIQIDSGKLELESQNLFIQMYRSQLEGINASVEIQKNQVAVQQSQVEVEKLKIEQFGSQVQAYQSKVQAKVSEFNLFTAQVNGEKAKAEIYAEEIRGFSAEVDAYKASIEANKIKVDSSVDREKINIAQFAQKVEAYKAELDGVKTQILADSTNFTESVTAYNSDISAKVQDARSDLATYSEQSRIGIANMNAETEKVKTKFSETIELQKLYELVDESGATMATELAKAAMSGLNTIVKFGDDTLTQK